jgi:hypothetical protein
MEVLNFRVIYPVGSLCTCYVCTLHYRWLNLDLGTAVLQQYACDLFFVLSELSRRGAMGQDPRGPATQTLKM